MVSMYPGAHAMTDLVDRLFPEPEEPPAGRWEIAGDDSTWVEE